MGKEGLTLVVMGSLMLSIAKLSGGMTNYYLQVAAAQDYYAAPGEPDGVWLPTQGAKLLGLSGKADPDAVRLLLQGFSPFTGEPLVANAGHATRVLGHDLTWSAPKDVSLEWAVLPPEERHHVPPIHLEAVMEGLRYLEETACITRRGCGGYRHERASFLAVGFLHTTSRALSPQVHMHTIVFHLAVHPDRTMTALHSRPLYLHQIEAGVRYQKALARGLEQKMGIRTVFQGRHFTIPGIPKELRHRLSPRRQDVVMDMQRMGDFSRAAAQKACLRTRGPSMHLPAGAEPFDEWLTTATAYGFSRERALSLLHQVGPTRRAGQDPSPHAPVTSANATPGHNAGPAQRVPRASTTPHAPNPPAGPTDQAPRPDRPQSQNPLPSRPPRSPLPADHRDTLDLDAFRLDARLSRQIEELLSNPRQPRIPRGLNTLIRQYLESDSRLRTRTERQVKSLLSSRRRAVRSSKIQAVLARYSHARNPLLEEIRYHFAQIRKAAMHQPTRPIDREQTRRDAQVRLDQAHADAVRSLVSDRRRLSVLKHQPSYNSDWVLRVAREAWQRAGYQVLGTALTRQRVQQMQTRMGFNEAMTLRTLQLRMDPTLPFRLKHAARQLIRAAQKKRTYTIQPLQISKKTILIVDAADTLSMSQLAFLTEKVKRQGGKMVLVEGSSPTPLPNTAFDLIARHIQRKKDPPDKPRPDPASPRPATDTQVKRPTPLSQEI